MDSNRNLETGWFNSRRSSVCQRIWLCPCNCNRTFRELAQEGILERCRKAGTRVVMPVGRSANFEIPRIRLEIEETGATYRYALLLREVTVPPANVRSKLETSQEIRSLHLHCLHYSNEAPFQFEDRWINLKSIPEVEETIQMNGWSSMYPGQMLNIFFLQPMPIWNKPNCFHWQNAMRFLLFNAGPGAKKI